MDRKEELERIFEGADEADRKVVAPLIEEAAFLEERLRYLRTLPHIRVHPRNPARQEATPAGRQYREALGAYINAIKLLEKVLTKAQGTAESPLARMLEEFSGDGF